MPDAVVAERLAQIASILSGRAEELTAELVELYNRELPELINDDESMVSLLYASVYQNIDTALRIFQHGIDPARVEAPAAAMEYARRLAQRGTPVIDLIRAYYLGQTAILDHALDEGSRHIDHPGTLGVTMRSALTTTFAFIDRVTQQVVSAYQEERDRWLFHQSAVLTSRVRALLDGDLTDVDESEAAVGYRLRGHHVGVIAWYARGSPGTPGTPPTDALTRLEALASRFRDDAMGARPLFVPRDEVSAWVWLPVPEPVLPDAGRVRRALAEADPAVRVAFGDPGAGIEGFRRTHRQALRVQALALAAGEHCDRVLTFRDVGTVALMTSDLAAARTWVADTLGALAENDEQHARLRETLRVFLATGGSYTAAAAQLSMHKNSVQYRVRKAQELLGRPVSDHRLDVEMALTVCHRLGGAVLDGQHARRS
ncbi:PucR-like helix-turn-helix protein [Prauserella shujinwangii]|uniref:PucR-like helix-turn-helix protein n=1 Tax=Prauserella shujinwangii TaxID=1453103 RepID=A0A2T0LST3_9PSEU|nr:helix-turn-helix domain-containing protein [Prauserella shujinwangii]PRX46716.1 PucR-like helix-turn-helix protein [Prauserella shujinwangii]